MEKSKKGIRAAIATVTASIILAIIGAMYVNAEMMGPIGSAMVVLFIYAKFTMAMMFTQGWKVFNRKTILGMPVVLFVIYTILATLLVLMYITSRQLGPDFANSANNFLSLIVSASIGVVGTFCMWYMGVSQWMAGGSEYDARVQFKNKGYSDEVVEQKITELRNLGVI